MKKLVLISLVICLVAYLSLPYFELWQLGRIAVQDNGTELERFIDIKAIRKSVKLRLNKDFNVVNEEASNAFVNWLQDGIRRLGDHAIDNLVTTDWVRQQLLSKTAPNEPRGFLQHVTYAFFYSPNKFLVRIGELDEDPIHLLFTLTINGWYLTGVYN